MSSAKTRSSCTAATALAAGCSTKVNSPRKRLLSAASQAANSAAGRVWISSNCLVNSRPMVTARGPQTASACAKASIRWGASSSTTARACFSRSSSTAARSAALAGKKPANTKPGAAVSSIPAALSSAETLLAPGSGITRKPWSRNWATKRAPGSLMPGVPASLTYATRCPWRSRVVTSWAACISLCWCTASSCAAGLSMP